jgi:hypothetical protein
LRLFDRSSTWQPLGSHKKKPTWTFEGGGEEMSYLLSSTKAPMSAKLVAVEERDPVGLGQLESSVPSKGEVPHWQPRRRTLPTCDALSKMAQDCT